MAVPNLMSALEEIGGLKTVSEMYAGKSGKASREFGLLKRVINRDGVITKDEMDYLNKSIWRKYKDMDPEARAAAGKLKGGLLKDLDTVLDPELGQTLGAIRTAADDAYKQAETFLQSTPLAGDLMKAGRPEAKARQFFNLFSEGHKQDAMAIRDHLLTTGNKDLWDTTKASDLEGVFNRATKLSEDTGETVFQPGAFINWFDKHGKGAMEVMPEHAAARREWYNVSKGLLKDFKRYGERGREGVIPSLKLGALSGGGFLAGGVPGVVVSNGFALLSALGTMGRRGRIAKPRRATIMRGPELNHLPFLANSQYRPAHRNARPHQMKVGIFEAAYHPLTPHPRFYPKNPIHPGAMHTICTPNKKEVSRL
jgi:hypothetical protein